MTHTFTQTFPLVFQDWMLQLTMQQQSVLVLACRGPDGVPKFHPTKFMTTLYRASVLKAAYLGRAMRPGEGDDTTFMTLEGFDDSDAWLKYKRWFFDNADSLPHHYYMHLMHGAQIIGYKHDNHMFRYRWLDFYHTCCSDLHLKPESEHEMDTRLNDWNREHWEK